MKPITVLHIGDRADLDLVDLGVATATRPVILMTGAGGHTMVDGLATRMAPTLDAAAIAAAVRAERPRVLHAHGDAVASAVSTAARRHRLPWVLSPGPDGVGDPSVSVVVVRSAVDGERLRAAGVPSSKLAVVRPGVDVAPRMAATHPPDVRVVGTGLEQFGKQLVTDEELADAGVLVCAADAPVPLVLAAEMRGIPLVLCQPSDRLREVVAADGAVIVGDADEVPSALDRLVRSSAARAALGVAGRRHAMLGFERSARVAELEAIERAVDASRPVPATGGPVRAEWPTVSVVITTLNRRELLGRTLDALEAQTYPADKVEVVVLDNGSTDGTSEDLAARRPPWALRTLRHEITKTAAEGRNTALTAATGDVVCFTDSDCRPAPTWLEVMVAGMGAGVDIVQGWTGADPEQDNPPYSKTQWIGFEYGLYETCNLAVRAETLAGQGPAPFHPDVGRELTRVAGPKLGMQPFGEDADLAWRMKRRGAVSRFARNGVVHHHVFPSSRRDLLMRSRLVVGFPILARRAPELREEFFFRRWFLGPHRPAVDLAIFGAVVAVAGKRWALLLTVPYAVRIGRAALPAGQLALGPPAVQLGVDAIETAALAWGSARTGTLVI